MNATEDVPAHTPRVGATLFSFGREYCTGAWSLRDCMVRLASLGGEQHLEVIGAQSLSSYPALSSESEYEFRAAVDESGVVPWCYDADVDLGWIAGRPFPAARISELLIDNMIIARRLGFPMFRINTATPDLVDSLLPEAERLDLKIVVELHAKTIESPEMQALLSLFERRGSPRLGFLQDLGSFTQSVPRAFLDYKARAGVPDDLLGVIADGYLVGRAHRDVAEEVRARGGDALAESTAAECFSMFKNTPTATLVDVIPHLRHIHAKFYEILDGDEPCIPYAAIIDRLRAGGYGGVLSSEYGGFQFIEEPIAYDQVRAHHELMRRLWSCSSPR